MAEAEKPTKGRGCLLYTSRTAHPEKSSIYGKAANLAEYKPTEPPPSAAQLLGGNRMKILLAIFCFPVFLLLELAKKQ